MKTIIVPSFLHDVFGEKTTLAEILMILLVGLFTSISLFVFTRSEWQGLALWRVALLFLLTLDILAGFIANLTRSTNDYYQSRPKHRIIFITVHIQPLLLSALLGGYFPVCFAMWSYTTAAAFFVNAMKGHPAQKALAASLVTLGMVSLFLFSNSMPILLLTALTFYHLKVAYSFSVDHFTS